MESSSSTSGFPVKVETLVSNDRSSEVSRINGHIGLGRLVSGYFLLGLVLVVLVFVNKTFTNQPLVSLSPSVLVMLAALTAGLFLSGVCFVILRWSVLDLYHDLVKKHFAIWACFVVVVAVAIAWAVSQGFQSERNDPNKWSRLLKRFCIACVSFSLPWLAFFFFRARHYELLGHRATDEAAERGRREKEIERMKKLNEDRQKQMKAIKEWEQAKAKKDKEEMDAYNRQMEEWGMGILKESKPNLSDEEARLCYRTIKDKYDNQRQSYEEQETERRADYLSRMDYSYESYKYDPDSLETLLKKGICP